MSQRNVSIQPPVNRDLSVGDYVFAVVGSLVLFMVFSGLFYLIINFFFEG